MTQIMLLPSFLRSYNNIMFGYKPMNTSSWAAVTAPMDCILPKEAHTHELDLRTLPGTLPASSSVADLEGPTISGVEALESHADTHAAQGGTAEFSDS